jgi:hypothetical protein
MEPIISTSFIPKRPVSSEPVAPTKHGGSVGLLSFVTVIIVVGTAVIYGGVYLYQQSLVKQQASLQASISAAQDGLGTSFVTDMQRLSDRINGVKTLLQNHVVVSPIFDALQATTLQSVQYKDFTYEFTTDDTTNAKMVEVHITGVANNYATLALQSDAFAQSPIIKNPIFSNLTVEDQSNLVDFSLVFDVNPSDLSYETFINNLNASTPGQAAATTTTTAPTTIPATPTITSPTGTQ